MTTLTEPLLGAHGIYGMKGEEVAQLIPAIYKNTIEEYKKDTRKCLIQIFVPDIGTMYNVKDYIYNSKIYIDMDRVYNELRLTYGDYDIHIVLTDDYTAAGMYKQFIKKADEFKTIAMVLYGEMDVVVEEYLFDKFIHSGKLFGMLVTN